MRMQNYVDDFDRAYTSDAEHVQRKSIFASRLQVIKQHNGEDHHTWKRGVNPLTDRTPAELKGLHGLNKPLLHDQKATAAPYKKEYKGVDDTSALPDSIDWRMHAPPVLTPIKNQGSCTLPNMSPRAVSATSAMPTNIYFDMGYFCTLLFFGTLPITCTRKSQIIVSGGCTHGTWGCT